jgi:hypothetical protein
LSVCGSREDGALVVSDDLDPFGDIGRVILARLLVQFQIGAKKSGANLGDRFLAAGR